MESKQVSRKQLIPVLFFLSGLLVVAGYFAYTYLNSPGKQGTQPTRLTEKDVEKVVNNVGKLIVLPENETPTVAGVADVNLVKGQVFFAKAENGDRILIYMKAKKAYLYRPSINKLIEVGPLNIENITPTSSNTTQGTEASPSVILVSPSASFE